MRVQSFVDRTFIYNFIRNQNELDDYAVDVIQFYTVLGINTSVFEVRWKSKQVIVDRLP